MFPQNLGSKQSALWGIGNVFFSEVLKEMKGRLFANGVPTASTAALADNEFLYAGNLMAASILQGGTAPCFLKTWVYDYMIMGLSEALELSIDDITASEMKNFVEKVRTSTIKYLQERCAPGI